MRTHLRAQPRIGGSGTYVALGAIFAGLTWLAILVLALFLIAIGMVAIAALVLTGLILVNDGAFAAGRTLLAALLGIFTGTILAVFVSSLISGA